MQTAAIFRSSALRGRGSRFRAWNACDSRAATRCAHLFAPTNTRDAALRTDPYLRTQLIRVNCTLNAIYTHRDARADRCAGAGVTRQFHAEPTTYSMHCSTCLPAYNHCSQSCPRNSNYPTDSTCIHLYPPVQYSLANWAASVNYQVRKIERGGCGAKEKRGNPSSGKKQQDIRWTVTPLIAAEIAAN